MPEHLEIIVVRDPAPAPRERELVIEALRRVAGDWIGAPTRLVLHDVDRLELTTTSWAERRSALSRPLDPETLLFVYADGPPDTDGCIGLHESAGKASYTLSIPLGRLDGLKGVELEAKIARLYDEAHGSGPGAVLCGPELDVDLGPESLADLVRSFFGRPSLAWWILAPATAAGGDTHPFRTVWLRDGLRLLRIDEAITWLEERSRVRQ